MSVMISSRKALYTLSGLIAVIVVIYISIDDDDFYPHKTQFGLAREPSNLKRRSRPERDDRNFGGIIDTIFAERIGIDMLEGSFQIFSQRQTKCSKILLEKIAKGSDLLALRTLGYCCGRTGETSRLMWLHENLKEDEYQSARIGYFEGLAMIGSSAVIEQWESLENNNSERDRLMSVALLILCETDAQDAEDLLYYWVEKNPHRLWARNPAVIQVIEKMLQFDDISSDHLLANDRFLTLCQGNFSRVAMEIAKSDPKRAREWALARDSVSDRIAAVKGILLAEAAKGGNKKVMDSIVELSASGRVPVGNMMKDVLLFKLNRGTAEAEEWIDAIGEDHKLYDQSCGVFVSRWAAEDQFAVSQWISGLPAGRKRDISAFHLASDLKSLTEAMNWCNSIEDASLRDSLFKQFRIKFDNSDILNAVDDPNIAPKLSASEMNILLNL